MAGEYIQTLAQLLAANKVANTQQIGNPQAGQMGFQTGTVDQGYGAVGEAFGKGASDYINQTVVQAQKNKYMQENDPIEIEKRASEMFKVYSNLPLEEKNNFDKWLNEDPEGLKWLDKLNKHAKHLMTKVPPPEDYVPKPGEAPDDVTWYRPLRVIQDEKTQKSAMLSRMTPQQQVPFLFAGENKDNAEALKIKAEAGVIPQKADAETMVAEAARTKAKADADLVGPQSDYYKAEADHRRAQAEKDRKWKPASDTLGTRLLIQKFKNNQQELDNISAEWKTSVAKVLASPTAVNPTARELAVMPLDIDMATKLSGVDYFSKRALGTYNNVASKLAVKGRETIAKSGTNDMTRRNYFTQADNLLTNWEKNINGRAGHKAYIDAYRILRSYYWREFYPMAKTKDQAFDMIRQELASKSAPDIMKELDAEEKKERAEREFLNNYQIQVQQEVGGQ